MASELFLYNPKVSIDVGKYKEIGTKSALIWENTKRMEQIYHRCMQWILDQLGDFFHSQLLISRGKYKAVLEGYVGESKTKWEIYSN